MKKIVIILLASFLLSSCVIPFHRDNVQAADVKREGVVLKGNYQELLHCWDSHSRKINVDNRNGTDSALYPDIGIAEIFVRWNQGVAYAIFIELKKQDEKTTVVNAYGAGAMGREVIPEWMEVLNACQAKG